MSTKKVERFLEKLTHMSIKHGVVIEGNCPIPAVLAKLPMEEIPGRYKAVRDKKRVLFRWVADLMD